MSRRLPHLTLLLSALLVACGLSSQQIPDRVTSNIGAGHLVSVPLERLATGHQLLDASINGHPVRLIVDTAAEGLVIDNDERVSLGVDARQVIGTDRAAGIGGSLVVTRHALTSLSVGGATLATTSIAATDIDSVLAALSRVAGGPIKGILGQDVLVAHGAVLDIGGDRLHLRTAADIGTGGLDPALEAEGYRPIPLQPLANGMQALAAQINDAPALLVLDSGARLSVLDSARAQQWALAPSTSTSTVGGAGGGGSAQISEHAIRSMALGDFLLDIDQAAATDLSAVVAVVLERGGLEMDGVLGLDVLRRHRAIIDLASGTLYLADPLLAR